MIALPHRLQVGVLTICLGVFLVGCGSEPNPGAATAAPTARPGRRGTATPIATWTAEPVTPTPTATPTATPTPIIYAIQQGDTLLDVATRFHVSAAEIQEANGITDPRLLQIGQEIIIPNLGEAEAAGTPTPTPMPVHVASQRDVLTTAGDAIVLGEVVNDSGQGVEEVTVAIELQDGTGHVVHRVETAVLGDIIAPGAKTPFGVTIFGAPSYAKAVARVIRAMPEVPERAVHRDLRVAEISGRAVYDRTFVLVGKVRNYGEEPALDVFVVVTLYGRDGAVIGAAREPLPDVLESGDRALFQVSVVPIGWPVESFVVSVEGRQPDPTPMPGLGPTPTSTG